MSTLAPVNAPDSVIAERALRHEFARHGRTVDIALHHEEAARPFNRVAIEVTAVDGRTVGRSALRCYVFTVEIERPRALRHPVNRAERIATNARAGRRRHERTIGAERVDDIAERVHRGALLRTHVPADWPGVKAQCARHSLPTIREDGECYVS